MCHNWMECFPNTDGLEAGFGARGHEQSVHAGSACPESHQGDIKLADGWYLDHIEEKSIPTESENLRNIIMIESTD